MKVLLIEKLLNFFFFFFFFWGGGGGGDPKLLRKNILDFEYYRNQNGTEDKFLSFF